mgnify:CR=1 FL=1|jgi:aspartate racemase
MAQHIGIVGCSPPGAALCYQTICTERSTTDDEHTVSPEVTLHSHPFREYMRRIDLGDWQGVGQLMLSSAENLAQLGANFCIVPCNTIHLAFEHMHSRLPLPCLHIAEEVALEAKRQGFQRVALLGTRLLMESRVYATEFEKAGIEWRIPDEDGRERIDRLIFDEMVRGIFTFEARTCLLQIIEKLCADGCDAVGMCCTELPMLLSQAEAPLPLLDSTKILALAALNRSDFGDPRSS